MGIDLDVPNKFRRQPLATLQRTCQSIEFEVKQTAKLVNTPLKRYRETRSILKSWAQPEVPALMAQFRSRSSAVLSFGLRVAECEI